MLAVGGGAALSWLGVRSNRLGDAGASTLFGALRRAGPRLRELDVRDNGVWDAGALALASALVSQREARRLLARAHLDER